MRQLLQIALLLITVSCIKEIKVDHPSMEKLLTLNCVLREGYPVRASLSSTMAYGTPGFSPYYNDGLIVLSENGNVVDTLVICEKEFLQASLDTIWYYCSSHPIKAGKTYQVKASKSGFSTVSGETTIPAKPKIIKIESTEDNDFGDLYEIVIEDTEPGKNFYIIQMRIRDFNGDIVTTQLTTADPTISIYQSSIPFQLPINDVTGSTAYFTEQYFVNNRRTIKLRATLTDLNKANEVLLISATEEYFNYRRAIDINTAVGENPFSEPVHFKSNVDKGFGIVGGESINLFPF